MVNRLSFNKLQLRHDIRDDDASSSRADTPGSEPSDVSEEVESALQPSRLKALTPGLGQCDVLTEEVRNWNIKLVGM